MRLSTIIALGAVLWGADTWRCEHRRRLDERPRAQPEPLQTWEGEGGGVPVDTHRTAASRVRSDDLLSPGGEV